MDPWFVEEIARGRREHLRAEAERMRPLRRRRRYRNRWLRRLGATLVNTGERLLRAVEIA